MISQHRASVTLCMTLCMGLAAASQARERYAAYLEREMAALPGEPIDLCDCRIDSLKFHNDTHAQFEVLDVNHPDFTQAVRVQIKKLGDTGYTVQLQTPDFTSDVHKGDTLLVCLSARCPSVLDETGEGRAQVICQLNHAPWTGLGSTAVTTTLRREATF